MPFDAVTAWLAAAGLVLMIELISGTVFLLLLAGGLATAAATAWFGGSLAVQMLAAAITGASAALALHRHRQAHGHGTPPPDAQPLDLGHEVEVDAWQDGGSIVHHRGARWAARLVQGEPARAGRHVIVGIEGCTLQLKPRPRSP